MMEELYRQFTEQLLPKIQQGLVITKDYFFDLFARYTQYLIVIDTILAATLLILSIAPIWICIKYRRKIIDDTDGGAFMMLLILIFTVPFFFVKLDDLIKDIYIPEIRIYEILKQYK